jgi:hypothetical protein
MTNQNNAGDDAPPRPSLAGPHEGDFVMDDWKYNAELSQAFGSREWLSAEIKTKAKSYRLSTSDFNLTGATLSLPT